MKKKEYRPDIDVLRAIAVLAVVFYHAHIPYFQGGYIGVSIFFVISGYLITGIIKRKIENNSFSFLEFYENRLRRILPALVVMMLIVMGVYYIFTSHLELLPLQRSVKRAIVGFANIYFYFNTNYFDQAAETMPLLHTWSLGVEEQFYFIMPALLFLLYKKLQGKLNIIHILYFLCFISFISSLILIQHNQKFTFYMLPTRAWELLMGSILAYTNWTPKNQRNKLVCTLSGLILIILSIGFYKQILFPGFWALPPCLGACLYIAGGNNAQKSLIHKITYNKILLFIGLISYSLYLWHWPIFVFYQTFPFYTKISTFEGLMLSLFAIIIASLSWKFIENPIRYNPFFKKRTVIWTFSAFLIGIILILATLFRHTNVGVIYNYTAPNRYLENNINDKKNELDFVVVGDSYLLHIEPLLSELAQTYQLNGTKNFQVIKNCVKKNEDQQQIQKYKDQWNTLSQLYKKYHIKNIFLIFRLTEKLSGKDIYYNNFSPERPLVYLPNKQLSPEQGFLQGLRDMILEAKEHGVKNIYIQLPVPEPKAFIPQKASVLHRFYNYNNKQINATLGESVEEYKIRTKIVMDLLSQLKKEFPDIHFIDIAPSFLDKEKTLYKVVTDNTSFYYDDDHLSYEGTLQHYSVYDEIFAHIKDQITKDIPKN